VIISPHLSVTKYLDNIASSLCNKISSTTTMMTMALQLWENLKESITAYTGLSPETFFTYIALAFAVYYTISSFFGSSDRGHQTRHRALEPEMEPLPPPVQLGEVTLEELKQYDGSDLKKPLLMAIKGQIYDVSQSRVFYGPGGPYHMFTGKDASRALAKMSFEDKDLNGDLSDLGVFEMEALQDWEYKFMEKYIKVGTVKTKSVAVTEAESETEVATTSTETNAADEKKPAEVSQPENGGLESVSAEKTENKSE